jgi:hypothetical protein
VVQKYTGEVIVLRQYEAPHINKDSLLLKVFMLFFLEIMQLLVEETNRYYHQYLETVVEGCSPLPDVTIPEMHLFLGHNQTDR